ncbi:MAG: hypothetical protein M3167_06145 [Acidobacteriota bacterium]|nr:hypothetical protein [Acidobacteriota bacterium]MDQ6892245.1 hypothetical protein [Acidobacteriota bacterium]
MPLCDKPPCNAEVQYLPRTTPKGRRSFVIVDAKPEKRWVEIEGRATLANTYAEHRPPVCVGKTEKAAAEE